MGVTVFDEYSAKSAGKTGASKPWTRAAWYRPLFNKTLATLPVPVMQRFGGADREFAVAVVLARSPAMRLLNLRFRGKDASTDVLSFESPAEEYPYLGEIVLCPAFARASARSMKRSLELELSLLFVHGLLHLLGYDHRNVRQRKRMFALQDAILGTRVRYD